MTNTEGLPVSTASPNRRRLIQSAAASALLLPASPGLAASVAGRPHTFVLVHGAWHGGWCWQQVADVLHAQGHRVYTPTLTGCGERVHLATSETNLRTHVTDVLATLHYEDLGDVVLVGHSYAGMIIGQVACEAAMRIRSVVYLDAFLPDPGQSFADVVGQDLEPLAVRGSVPPMLTTEELGIAAPALKAFVEARLTPHPLAAFEQGIDFDPEALAGLPRTFIQTSDLFEAEARKAAAAGFRVENIQEAGHDVMLTRPVELARMLLALA